MKRSPLLIAAFLFVWIAGVWAQQTPANPEPKDASGTPQAPIANPPSQNTAPNPPASAQQPPAIPSPSPVANPTPGATGGTQSAPAGSSTQPASGDQPASGSQPASGTPAGSGTKTSGQDKPASAQKSTGPTEPEPPQQPKTEILDSSATSGGLTTDGHDPVLDPPPFPSGSTTLVGGIIRDVDRIRNRMVVHVFGGNRWTVNFDERTHIFRNGAQTTPLALKKGERVYVDTMLDTSRHDIFARNIRVGVAAPPADADGQVMAIDTAHGEVTLRDNINSVPVHFGVDKETRISSGNTPTALQAIKPGALVHVKFAPESGNRGIAREIIIVAAPGAAFTFVGKLTYLDLRRGLLAVQNTTDGKTYDIHFLPRRTEDQDKLGVGANVKIVATFEGTQYTAQSVQVTESGETSDRDKDK